MFLFLPAIIIGIILLWQGADFLIRGGQGIAKNLDVSPIVIAITIIALGTSLPELVVRVLAALGGNADIALGNTVGSNIANIGWVLGFSVLCLGSVSMDRHMLSKEFPFMIAAPVVLFLLGLDGLFSRLDGIILIAISVLFHLILIKRVREGKFRRMIEDIGEAVIQKEKKYLFYVLAIVLGLIGLILGAKLVIDSSVGIASILRIPTLIIGLTLVTFGTSLPELATSLIAAKRRQGEVSLGDVVGSNILNIFLILGITLVIVPIPIPRSVLIFDVPVMAVFALLLFLALLKYGKLRRREAAVLLGLYAVYIGYSFLK
ncbi:MAG: calcium/sodium antiporter [Candidatus Jacksonbacteria bacterium]